MADEPSNLVPLHDLDGFDVADGYTDIRGFDAVLPSGRKAGTVRELLVDPAARRVAALTVELHGGFRDARVPIQHVQIDSEARRVRVAEAGVEALGVSDDDNRTVILSHDPDAAPSPTDRARPAMAAADAGGEAGDREMSDGERRIVLAEEELALFKERVAAGAVDVHKTVETRHVREAVPVMRDEVTVERRAVGDDYAERRPHYVGDELHIPLVEEVLVVEKRQVVKEELVIRKTQVQREQVVEADLRRERADVQRTGDVDEAAGDAMH